MNGRCRETRWRQDLPLDVLGQILRLAVEHEGLNRDAERLPGLAESSHDPEIQPVWLRHQYKNGELDGLYQLKNALKVIILTAPLKRARYRRFLHGRKARKRMHHLHQDESTIQRLLCQLY